MAQRAQREVSHRPAALADAAFETLRTDLVAGGQLTASRRLVAGDLARQLGVSRTPVREALDRLARLGYLTALDGGGYERRRYRTRDIRDVYELRRLLEPYAAELAAHKAASIDRSTADERLGIPVSRASGNRVLSHLIELLAERVAAIGVDAPWRSREPRGARNAPDVADAETSRAVAAAIERGDSAAARAAMEQHIAAEMQALMARDARADAREGGVVARD